MPRDPIIDDIFKKINNVPLAQDTPENDPDTQEIIRKVKSLPELLPSPYSPTSLGRAAVGDIKEFATGTAALASGLFKGAIRTVYDPEADKFRFSAEPFKEVPGVVKAAFEAIKSDFQEYLEDPAGKFARDPLFFIFDVGTLATGGIGIAAKGAKIAKFTSLASALERVSTPERIATLAIEPLRRHVPIVNSAMTNIRLGKQFNKVAATQRKAFFIERGKEMHNWNEAFSKMPMPDKDVFYDIVEKTALSKEAIEQIQTAGGKIDYLKVMPDEISPELQAVLDKWKRLSKEEQEILQAVNLSSPERAEAVIYKPLSGYTDLSVDQLKSILGTNEPWFLPHYFERKIKAAMFLLNQPVKVSKHTFLRERTTGTGRLIEPKDPRIGKFISDPQNLLTIHRIDFLKWQHNQILVKEIEKHFGAKVTNMDDLRKGLNNGTYFDKQANQWKVIERPEDFDSLMRQGITVARGRPWYSEGYLRFYKDEINMLEEVAKKVEKYGDAEVVSAFEDAIAAFTPEVLEAVTKPKNIVGVSSQVPIHIVPQKIHDLVSEYVNPPSRGAFGQMLLAYDNATQLLRYAWLAYSPRWVINNTAGNVILTALAGMNPINFFRAFKKEYKDLVPESVTPGIFAAELYNPHPGRLADTPTGMMIDYVKNNAVLKGLAKHTPSVRGINEAIEAHFRRALYIDRATKLKQKVHFQKATLGLFETDELSTLLKNISDRPELVQLLTDEVNKWLFDYFALSNFERRKWRRVVPFYSWIKNINRLVYSLPMQHPLRAELISIIGRVTDDITNQDELPPEIRGTVALSRHIRLRGGGLAALSDILYPSASAVPKLGLHPLFDFAAELMTGTDPFTWRRIQRGDTIVDFITGQVFQYDPNIKDLKRVDKATPSLPAHIAEQIPQYHLFHGLMEIINQKVLNEKPVPIKTNIGYVYPPSPFIKMLQWVGIPTLPAPLGDWKKREQEALRRTRTIFMNRMIRHMAIEERNERIKHKALGGLNWWK